MKRLLLCLLLPTVLLAESLLDKEEQAQLLVDMQQYEEAAEVYEEILAGDLTDKQRANVFFNLGNVQLLQKKWQLALDRYGDVTVDQDTQPLLARELSVNRAVALLGLAEDGAVQGGVDALKEAVEKVQEAVDEMQRALESDRTYALFEGRELSNTPEELLELHRYLGLRYYQLREELLDTQLQALSEKDLAALLLVEQEGLRQNLDSQLTMDQSSEREQQLGISLYIRMKESERVWQVLRRRLENIGEDESQQATMQAALAFYLAAEQSDLSTKELLQVPDLPSAQAYMSVSVVQLEALKALLQEEDPVDLVLLRLLGLRSGQAGGLDDRLLTDYAAKLLEALDFEAREVNQEENLIAQALVRQSSASIRQEGASSARTGLYLYRQALLSESDTLMVLLSEFVQIRKKGALPEKWADRQDEMRGQLEALQAKWEQRLQVSKDPQRVQRALEALAAVREKFASEIKLPEAEIVERELEQLLEEWDLRALLEVNLAELVDAYQVALAAGAGTLGEVERLNATVQQRMGTLASRETVDGDVLQSLSVADAFLQVALPAGSPWKISLFAKAAANETGYTFLHFTGKFPGDAVKRLSLTVDQQLMAVTASQIVDGQPAGMDADTEALLIQLQRRSLGLIGRFDEAVEQMASQDEQGAAVLQAEPWPDVMRLVEEGKQAAGEAQRKLSVAELDPPSFIPDQKLAHQKWKEALELFKDQSESDGQSSPEEQDQSGGESGDSDDEPEEEQPPPPSEEERSEGEPPEIPQAPQKVFDLLNRMEQEDKALEGKKPVPKKGLKPW